MKRALLAVVVATVTLFAAAPAFAANSVVIRSVDTTKFPQVSISAIVNGPPPDLAGFTLRENGRLVPNINVVPLSKTSVPVGVVLAIDVSGSMNTNGKLDQAKAAAKQFVDQKQPNDQIALVTFDNQPHVVTQFTTDGATLDAAIGKLTAQGETALWDGVNAGLGLLHARPELQPNMVLLTDGKDTTSAASFDAVRTTAVAAKATVFSIGLAGGEFDEAGISGLAAATGGQYQRASDPRQLTTFYANVGRALQNQYQITYTSSLTGSFDLDLSVVGLAASVHGIHPGTVAHSAFPEPTFVKPVAGAGFLKSSAAKWIVVGFALVAVVLLAYGLLGLAFGRSPGLDSTLRPYLSASAAPAGAAPRHVGPFSMAETAVVQRAVEATARVARQQGLLQRVEALLEQADLPLRAAELIFFNAVALVVLTVIAGLLKGLLAGLVVAVVVGLVPSALLSFLARRRQLAFTSQLPDTLQLLAGTLRSGYSLLQGAEIVSQVVVDPMGRELKRIIVEGRLGRSLDDAFQDCADRVGSRDFQWAVMAIKIQRDVGGNLAELLTTVGETMVQRERLRREIRSLTAEGRISAIVLGLLPLGLAVLIRIFNKDYIKALFDSTGGKVAVVGAAALVLAGFYWMKQIVDIEV